MRLASSVPVTIGKACVRAAMPPSTPGCRPLRVHSAILARSGKMPANAGWEYAVMFRALTGALLMALASMAGAAPGPTGYWLCRSEQGETSAQDPPCDATAQTLSAPARASAPPPPSAQAQAQAQGQARPASPAVAPIPVADVKVRPNPFEPLIERVWSMSFAIIGLLAIATASRILFGGSRRRGRASRKLPRPRAGQPSVWRTSRKSPPVGASHLEERQQPAPADTARAVAPTQWSAQLLRALEWKRFEELCEGFWKAKGHAARGTGPGADGGVDVVIADSRDPDKTFAVVQCKAWSKPVGCEPVRALWGTREHLGAPLAIFYSVAGFTPDARAFAEGKHLKLVSGHELLTQLETLPPEASTALLQHVTRGDYTTPSCPTCEIKMTRRPGRGGRGDFWGCRNFRACGTRPIPVRVDA